MAEARIPRSGRTDGPFFPSPRACRARHPFPYWRHGRQPKMQRTTDSSRPPADENGSACASFPAAPDVPPPALLTREEVSCLKTALALVVVKRRLDQQHRNQNQEGDESRKSRREAEAHPRSSLCSLLVPPPLTQEASSDSTTGGGGGSSSASLPATNEPVPQPSADPPSTLATKAWASHLDHMMLVAQSSRPGVVGGTRWDPYRGTIAHIVRQIASTLAAFPEDCDDMEQWMYSYLVVLGEAGAALWTDVLYASQEKQLLRPGGDDDDDDATIIPTLMLAGLVRVLQNLLLVDGDDGKQRGEEESSSRGSAAKENEDYRRRADGAFVIQLFAHVIRYASPESVQQCWRDLGVGSLGSWNGAGSSKESHRHRRRRGSSSVGDADGSRDASSALDAALRPLRLRLWIADVYVEFHQESEAP